MGTLYNSKYRSGPMISMSKKFDIINRYKDETPGPGSYLSFSEFGIYVPKNQKKFLVNKRANSSKNSIKNYFKKKVIKRILSEEKSLLKKDSLLSTTL